MSTHTTSSTEQNKASKRRAFEEIWNSGNLEVVDELFAPSFIQHDPTAPIQGLEAFKQLVMMYHSAFPDFHVTVEDLIAEGEKVVSRYTIRGTHRGELLGIAPTGRQVTVTGISIVRFANGKVEENWNSPDALGMLQQLGVVPTMG